jgi:hypothetical protein
MQKPVVQFKDEKAMQKFLKRAKRAKELSEKDGSERKKR